MRKVLIVDDIALNRKILRKILEDEYDVSEASNGKEALEFLKDSGDDVSAVLLDLVMPVMDGYRVLSELRSNDRFKQLPVIVTTGNEQSGAEIKALTLGANDYIVKPYDPDTIKHRLRNTVHLRENAAVINATRIDALTGLYNRTAFFEKVSEVIATQPTGYYVMSCFDINGFKVVNDQYGSAKGDEVLRFIARVFKDGFDKHGGICCRISADNFAILYPRDAFSAQQLERIRHAAARLDGSILPLTYSIGRYVVDDLSLPASAMYDRAAIAKASIKGRYDVHVGVYDESMRREILKQQEIISEMNIALRNRQFEVWYQPQYNHASGALIGAEALVRWRHPTKGLVSPADFIPIFEKNGFIYELDKYVWARVCANLRKWLDEGRNPLPVSVNISRYDIFRDDLTDVLNALVAKFRLPVDLLRLEITESAFADSTEQIILVVKNLISFGYTVEIDDFGSGYSSLNTLKDVPADVLKLDMRFVENNENSQRGGNIMESIVRMAKWLGMSVIAEGVETIEQANFLKSIGCNYVQGYVYARPMPEADYEDFAKGARAENRLLALKTVETLNNSTFWDPKSMDTLIFNSYVGGACIFEYYHNTVEVLRANDKYAEVLCDGTGKVTLADALKISWNSLLDEENKRHMHHALQEAVSSGKEVDCEFCTERIPGYAEKTYLRVTLQMIASTGDRHLIYCTNENITAQRKAEMQIRDTDEQLVFLNNTAHELLTENDANSGIQRVLEKFLDYFCGNRAYIIEINYDAGVTDNTYEVCAEGIESEKKNLQKLPLSETAFWISAFENNNTVYISDVDALTDVPTEEKELLKAQNIHSLLAVSLRREGRLVGFIGIDDPRKHQSRADRLNAIGDSIAATLTRRDMGAKIQSDNRMLSSLMNDTPGGFVRMRVTGDGTVVPVYMNRGFCRLVNLPLDEAMLRFTKNAFANIHPEDLKVVQSAIKKMTETGEARSEPYRLCHGADNYRYVESFGRKILDENGEVYLNIYYTDVSDRNMLEQQRTELLENLPCGAGIYEINDTGNISIVYLNKRYLELIGRAVNLQNSDITALDAVLPEDRPKLLKTLSDSQLNNGTSECAIHIRHGNGGYRLFHLSGQVLKRGNGKTAIYTTYTPVTDEALANQEMLPAALSAMMKSSGEMISIKDTELRYLHCSHAFALFAGFTDEMDIIGKTDYDLMEKALAKRYEKIDNDILATKRPKLNYLELLPAHDGKTRHTNTSKYPLFDSDGKVIGIYCNVRDITEYQTAFERLRLLTDTIPGGIASFEIDADSVRLCYYNEGYISFSGYSKAEYAKKSAANPFFLVFEEDLPAIRAVLDTLRAGATNIQEGTFRCHTKDGGYRWFSMKGTVSNRHGKTVTVNTVQFDITDQKKTEERLRMSREQFRIASALGNRMVARYDIKTHTYYNDSPIFLEQGFGKEISNVPQAFLDSGMVAPGSVEDFCNLYTALQNGENDATSTVSLRVPDGSYRWFRLDTSTIFDTMGNPSEAILVFFDVTEQREKEAVYIRWQQSLKEKSPETYTLYRCNLSQNASFESTEGSLLQVHFPTEGASFDSNTTQYVNEFVHPEDREAYLSVMNSDTLLAGYYRGMRTKTVEYRETVAGQKPRWHRLSIELVEYPHSTDVMIYLMFEDIDREKRTLLKTQALAENDPLTGVLNRTAFATRLNRILSERQPGSLCALFMFDVDGFKLVNDSFGHAVGDQVLIDIAVSLRSIIRKDDLLGRLGGDEFLLCLCDLPNRAAIGKKASEICNAVRKSFSVEVQVSASVGVVVFPDDGVDFNTLYHKADIALYHVKATGRDNYVFYSRKMNDEKPHQETAVALPSVTAAAGRKLKRHMLIVDDNKLNREVLAHLFRDEFVVDTAEDGNSALIRLRRYGAGISIVLLDLMMPGMDGFAVLEKMRASAEMQSIPVIVVSSLDEKEAALRTIQCGASDFITKPVDANLLRVRVQSAISKAENERLRLQNCSLVMQGEENSRCRAVLDSQGIVTAEYDPAQNSFIYDSALGLYIAGQFDARPLWQILQSDNILTGDLTEQIENRIQSLLDDPDAAATAQFQLPLKTPSKETHTFELQLLKYNDESAETKVIFAFTDIDQ